MVETFTAPPADDVAGQLVLPQFRLPPMKQPKTTRRPRGPLGTENRDKVRPVRMPDELWQLAQDKATARGVNRSEWIRQAIIRYAAEQDRQQAYANKKAAASGKNRKPRPRLQKGAKKR